LGARDLLQKAVTATPDYAMAHSALADAQSALGYDANAQAEANKAFDLAGSLPREQSLWIEGRYYQATRKWDTSN
jgi:Flp pilus assembly protein TadD